MQTGTDRAEACECGPLVGSGRVDEDETADLLYAQSIPSCVRVAKLDEVVWVAELQNKA